MAGSCRGLTFSVANKGCAKVVLVVVECLDPMACAQASCNFLGDVYIALCQPRLLVTLECMDANAQLTMRFNVAALTLITTIDALILRGQSSGTGMTLTIDNAQGTESFGNPIVTSIDHILCEAVGSCSGTTFIVGHNVAVGNILWFEF